MTVEFERPLLIEHFIHKLIIEKTSGLKIKRYIYFRIFDFFKMQLLQQYKILIFITG